MISTSQLDAIPGALRCRCCGSMFEVTARCQSDPERLLIAKERIAAIHTCREYVPVARVRSYRMPSKRDELEIYWNQQVARLMPA